MTKNNYTIGEFWGGLFCGPLQTVYLPRDPPSAKKQSPGWIKGQYTWTALLGEAQEAFPKKKGVHVQLCVTACGVTAKTCTLGLQVFQVVLQVVLQGHILGVPHKQKFALSDFWCFKWCFKGMLQQKLVLLDCWCFKVMPHKQKLAVLDHQ